MDMISGNEFLSGGLVLGAIAGAVAMLRRHALFVVRWIAQRFVVEIDLRDGGMVMWFGVWLAHISYGKACRRLQVDVRQNRDDDEPMLNFEPGLGQHIFRYGYTLMYVERHRNDEDKEMSDGREWYRVRVFGSRERAIETLETAKRVARELLACRDSAYMSDGCGWWTRIGVGAPRPLSTVVLPGATTESIVNRINTFLEKRAWYEQRGIPWRLGFLFEGPPRTGKTSLVRAISHELGLPLYMLDLTAKEFSDKHLTMSLARLPMRAILLIEDIDEQLGAAGSLITLSGLLNALDGALATEGRILFVTTNVKEKLDAALVGEGRLDVHIHFGYATRAQARELFLRFFPGRLAEAQAFADALPDQTLPPAAIQEHLVARSEDVARAVREAALLARKEVREVRRDAAA